MLRIFPKAIGVDGVVNTHLQYLLEEQGLCGVGGRQVGDIWILGELYG